jgi:hypothetical protein
LQLEKLHTGPVTTLAIDSSGELMASGGHTTNKFDILNSNAYFRVWKVSEAAWGKVSYCRAGCSWEAAPNWRTTALYASRPVPICTLI